ncbi:virulence-associated V antigen [Aeromonas hydrophila]|uniref:virulence-associated V antigen n=1 Tax=Aeromonas hydrophila TaxID=644 RepID=UPI0025A9BE15|nr:virulence-associated V antigen [Aeromonas hydrophila]
MEISSYKKDPQLFLSDLGKVELNQLQGGSSSALDALVKLLQEKKIIITATYDKKIDSNPFADKVVTENEMLLKKVLAYFMPADSKNPGGQYDLQIKAGFEQLHKLINEAAAAGKTRFTLREFLAATHFSLTPDRIDDDVIGAMVDAMGSHNSTRDALKHEVAELTAELKIYGVIQSEINKALSASSGQTFKTDFNLMNYQLYGYGSQADFLKGPEFKLLSKISSDGVVEKAQQALTKAENELRRLKELDDSGWKITGSFERQQRLDAAQANVDNKKLMLEQAMAGQSVTVKYFLESGQKQSGAMSNVEDSYSYDKDNNKLGNFSTSVSDRSRPLNDQVSEKTTRLNEVSSRYNAAIEALNRFIQKYESVMQQILQAI